MYSHCLFCHTALGRNESIESFPVGRRLAFDGANGRFWVICASCKRWNLSPLEERWAAIDECERLFERTRTRMSTDNIGLARIAEGTELVRVGNALRPEMAAWRFGAQLAARRRQYRLVVAGGVVATVGLFVGVKAAGLGVVGGNWGWNLIKVAYERATRLALPTPSRSTVDERLAAERARGQAARERPLAAMAAPRVETKHVRDARLCVPVSGDALELQLPVIGRRNVVYEGAAVESVLPKILAKLNHSGGRVADERLAVTMLDGALAKGERDLVSGVIDLHAPLLRSTQTLGQADAGVRIALEMALNEQRERELLAGELLDLEFAWKEAEELARISDSLGSSAIDRALAALKTRIG